MYVTYIRVGSTRYRRNEITDDTALKGYETKFCDYCQNYSYDVLYIPCQLAVRIAESEISYL